jgi:signal transduction histidine kinase/ligand-binding sensor domain-containing protein
VKLLEEVSANLTSKAKRLNLSRSLPICFLLSILAGPSVWAVDPSRHISQYAHTAWRLQDGSIPGKPAAITQTKDGYIWIGTEVGLVRFDGVRFLQWTPPPGMLLRSSNIVSLLGARDGSLWIGTRSGLSHWTNGNLVNIEGSNAYIDSILEDSKGTVWVTRSRVRDWSGPLCQVARVQLRCYGKAEGIPTPSAAPLAEDTQGNLWIGSTGMLLRWQEKLAGKYPLKGLRASDLSYGVEGLAVARDNSLWVGVDNIGPGMGLERFLHGQWKPFVSPSLNGSTLVVMTLFLDRDDTVWVGTANRGIYTIRGEQVDHFGREDGLSSDTITGFYQDHEGDIWVTTPKGVDNFRDLPIVTFSTREGLFADYAFSVLARHDGTVWNANLGALDSLHNGNVSSIEVPNGLPGRFTQAMLEDRGSHLWVGVDGGIFVYSDRHFRPVLPVDGTRAVIAIAEDVEGTIWAELAGPSPRLVRIDDFQVREEILPPRMSPAFSVIADPRGGIWLSLFDGDLAHYEHGKLRRISMDPLKRNETHVGALYNIFVDSRAIVWGAASGGLVAYQEGRLQLLTEQNGLPCNFVYSVISDAHDALWLYSQCGLVKIEASELQKWWDNPDAKIQVQNFDASDGTQPAPAPYRPAAGRSSDGRLWFVSGSVLQMIDPDHTATNRSPPPVHLERLIVDGNDYPLTGEIHLPPIPRDVEIDYTALSFVAPQKVRFRYKLEGRDTAWQNPGTRRQAFYTDLRPGRYRFRVVASNNDGVWNEEGATLDLGIASAWYQTNRVLFLCVITVAFVVWSLYRLRVRQVARSISARFDERLAERTHMARDLHDTFLQTIQGSKLVADDALDGPSDPVRLRRAMEKLSEWLGRATEEGRAALNSLRTSTTETNDLAQALQRATEDGIIPGSMAVNFAVRGDARRMHPIVRDEIYRIGFEAIRNACLHSSADRLEVELTYGQDLALRVADNGVGIDSAVADRGKDRHFGLQGMRERAVRIGGKLTLVSSSTLGTEIKLVVPGGIVFQKTRPVRQTLLAKIRALVRLP